MSELRCLYVLMIMPNFAVFIGGPIVATILAG